MFYDDNYHPTDANDYDGDETSSFSGSSSGGGEDTEYKRMRKLQEDYKKLDPGYSKIKRKFTVNGKHTSIEIYHTPFHPGATIRNAVTGMFEKGYLVGSKDEDNFFSVILSTGETGPNPPLLFYDSPQQYERHFGVQISTETKSRWADKNLAARLRKK